MLDASSRDERCEHRLLLCGAMRREASVDSAVALRATHGVSRVTPRFRQIVTPETDKIKTHILSNL